MKTAELEGADLNYWVAQCDPSVATIRWERVGSNYLGFCRIGSSPEFFGLIIVGKEGAGIPLGVKQYNPSEDWGRAGPIIERERIGVAFGEFGGQWHALAVSGAITKTVGKGPTPLIAAMRAFVASKFGDEVPDIKETA